MTEPALQEQLARYLTNRDRQRLNAVDRVLATLRPYERRIVREAAIMGYVRGAMAGRSRATLNQPRDGDIPRDDTEMLIEVIDACISLGDLYPYLADASKGRRRRITKARLWPGEEARS